MINLTTISRTIKQGFLSFIRNGWLSLASITIMILTLLTIAVFLILNIVISAGITEIQDKMDVSVYFNDSAKEAQIVELQERLSKMPEVKEINYTSKEQALQKMKKNFADNEKILNPLGNENPLPASLGVKVYKVEDFDTIAKVFEKEDIKPLIHNVSYKKNETIIKRLYVATNFIRRTGFGVAALFTVTSLIIIFNTIRMAIYARQEEVEIMQLVGANKWFIKGPFIIEGMIIGLIGTLITQIIVIPTASYVIPIIDRYLGGGVSSNISVYLQGNILQIVGIQLLLGVLIGTISSYYAIRKYLKTI